MESGARSFSHHLVILARCSQESDVAKQPRCPHSVEQTLIKVPPCCSGAPSSWQGFRNPRCGVFREIGAGGDFSKVREKKINTVNVKKGKKKSFKEEMSNFGDRARFWRVRRHRRRPCSVWRTMLCVPFITYLFFLYFPAGWRGSAKEPAHERYGATPAAGWNPNVA